MVGKCLVCSMVVVDINRHCYLDRRHVWMVQWWYVYLYLLLWLRRLKRLKLYVTLHRCKTNSRFCLNCIVSLLPYHVWLNNLRYMPSLLLLHFNIHCSGHFLMRFCKDIITKFYLLSKVRAWASWRLVLRLCFWGNETTSFLQHWVFYFADLFDQ